MVNIEELEQIELEKINDEISDITELEQLITGGAKNRIPYIIDYPFYNQETGEITYKKMAIKLRPLTSVEWNNATGNKIQSSQTAVNLVKKALYTKNEEPFPPALVEKMPNGVINKLFTEIAKISGVQLNSPEAKQLLKDLMGF